MAKLVVATTNRGKLAEITILLEGVRFDLITLAEWPDVPSPEETGSTFEENARDKALYYAARTGELAVAEDSGLEIEGLDGAPGVMSARFGGVNTPSEDKFALIYDALGRKGALGSPARFVSAIALVARDTILFEARGTVVGRIAPEPRGHGGFGYDPIFFYPPLGRTFAELGAQKSAVSHRGEAFRALRDYLIRQELDAAAHGEQD